MEDKRGIPQQTIVVILAAGKGTRMGRGDLVKVCFEIDGVPAINRLVTVFKRQRFGRFLLVVGARADQVMETVTKDHPGLFYVHQEPPLGTGHAAKIAAEALQAIGYEGYVLVTMGDKLVDEAALEALVSGYVRQRADMALLTVPKTKAAEGWAGRVFVEEDGQALDIIERVDLARQMIADDLRTALSAGTTVTGEQLRGLIEGHIPEAKRQASAVGDLLALAGSSGTIAAKKLEEILEADKYNLAINGKHYTGRELDRLCAGVNPSLYLMRAEVFYQGVGMIRNDNAQGEYYVTDLVRLLAGLRDPQGNQRYRIRAVPVDHPEWVQGFNSPDQLLAIQDYVRRRKHQEGPAPQAGPRTSLKPTQYATVRQWLAKVEGKRSSLKRWLKEVYGPHDDLHRQKCRDLAGVLV